jgi:8-oxo-dGTP diphosphatase
MNSTEPQRDLVAYAADVVIWRVAETEDIGVEVLLIRRGKPPYEGLHALPGGHVGADETAEEAAVREAAEETGVDLDPDRLKWIGLYDAPGRDPRGRVVSAAYAIEVDTAVVAVAGDDAATAEWVPLGEAFEAGLAFDHDAILRRASLIMLAQKTAAAAK